MSDVYEFQNKIGPDTRPDWIKVAAGNGDILFHPRRDAPPFLIVKTAAGPVKAQVGDNVIRLADGSLEVRAQPAPGDAA